MASKPGIRDVLWMASGAAVFLILTLTVLHFHREENPAEQLAFKARRIELVDRMRVALASASEAEKSAVLAITDEDSKVFADQARAASTVVEQAQQQLDELLRTGGTEKERDLLGQFSQAFADVRRIDDDLLALAVKNTNLKAYDLTYGPAASALEEMNAALSALVAARRETPQGAKLTPLALGAEIAGLRLQTMLPPHIAEESDQRMDEMEALMTQQDAEVRRNLDALRALPEVGAATELQTAVSAWAKFSELEVRILALSRENTNVRSLTISLNRKRTVMLACQEALLALRQAIDEEPVVGVTYGRPAKPR
jgi:hypothetical protein